MQRDFQRILIVRTDRIGDVILTLPMAEVLRRHFPSIEIAMLIRQYTSEIIEDSPYVNQILSYDVKNRAIPFLKLAALLRSQKFDVVFHTHPRFRLALVTWFAGIPVRIGTGYRWYSFLFSKKVFEHRKDARFHELEYNLHLLQALGINGGFDSVRPHLEVNPSAQDRVRNILRELGVEEEKRLIILHPGSGRSARDWKPVNFGHLAAKIARIPDLRVLVTGGRGEEELVRAVCSAAGAGVVQLVDQLSIREYAALTKRAALFISNSTGPIHIAAAVGTPVVGLYPQVTAMSAARWGPYTEKKTILSPIGKPADCRRCVVGASQGCECMDSIGVDDVFNAAVASLDKFVFQTRGDTE